MKTRTWIFVALVAVALSIFGSMQGTSNDNVMSAGASALAVSEAGLAYLGGMDLMDYRAQGSDAAMVWAVFGGLAVLALAIAWVARRKASRCPECGERAMHAVHAELLSHEGGVSTYEETSVCDNCGHTEVKQVELIEDGNEVGAHFEGSNLGVNPSLYKGGWGGGGGSFGYAR